MRYFANPCREAEPAMRAGMLGMIDTPLQGTTTRSNALRADGVTWCADNGAFSDRWDADRWWTWVERLAPYAATCAFAVAPDVVADAEATAVRSAPWLDRLRVLGYPVAYVAQDGIEARRTPWSAFDVLFIGGTTEWKLGAAARAIAAVAIEEGKTVHMGRVNSLKRFTYARTIGCSSVDGTFLVHGANRRLPELLGWVRSVEQGDMLRGLPL